MLNERIALIEKIEKMRDARVIMYVLGDRQGLESQIAKDTIDIFVDHLDRIGTTRKISLILYTIGGDTLAAWNIVNLINQYCDEFEVIVPYKALSAGTLMCLRANKILMTKQAVLGPIDPSINTPLNPKLENNALIPNMPQTYPVSVESIKSYFDFAKSELKLKNTELGDVLLNLSEKVHPLVIGQTFRTIAQIKMIARKLLKNAKTDQKHIEKIIRFLCSDSGSHDYTINCKEASEELHLPVEEVNGELYVAIKELYEDFKTELMLGHAIDFQQMDSANPGQSDFSLKAGLIESNGSVNHCFSHKGLLTRMQLQPNQVQIVPRVTFTGWEEQKHPTKGR